jgi:hypothetical protein
MNSESIFYISVSFGIVGSIFGIGWGVAKILRALLNGED